MANKIQNTLSLFHDGFITAYSGDMKELTLTIECEYLAREFDPSFENFYVTLKDIEKFEFNPWMNDSLPREIKTDLKEIFQTDLEISYGEGEDENEAIVSCHRHAGYDGSAEIDNVGGELIIKARNIEIRNHNRDVITYEELHKVVEYYWKHGADSSFSTGLNIDTKCFAINNDTLTLKVKRSPIPVLILFWLMTSIIFLGPVFGFFYLNNTGTPFHFKWLFAAALNAVLGVIILRYASWNTFGKEIIKLDAEATWYTTDFKLFKRKKILTYSGRPKFGFTREGYIEDNKGKLLIHFENGTFESAVVMPIEEIEALIATLKKSQAK